MKSFDDCYEVDSESGCWLWRGPINNNGYGRWGNRYAHREAFRMAKGEIPPGLTIDHLCRVRHCCNPDHLEAVTHRENVRRAPRSHREVCVNGHHLTDENSWVRPTGSRRCRICFDNSRYRNRTTPVRRQKKRRESQNRAQSVQEMFA